MFLCPPFFYTSFRDSQRSKSVRSSARRYKDKTKATSNIVEITATKPIRPSRDLRANLCPPPPPSTREFADVTRPSKCRGVRGPLARHLSLILVAVTQPQQPKPVTAHRSCRLPSVKNNKKTARPNLLACPINRACDAASRRPIKKCDRCGRGGGTASCGHPHGLRAMATSEVSGHVWRSRRTKMHAGVPPLVSRARFGRIRTACHPWAAASPPATTAVLRGARLARLAFGERCGPSPLPPAGTRPGTGHTNRECALRFGMAWRRDESY